MGVNLESRVAELERQVARLQKHQKNRSGPTGREWLEDLYGAFASDPVFEKAMKLGRRYRQSLRPRGGRKSGR